MRLGGKLEEVAVGDALAAGVSAFVTVVKADLRFIAAPAEEDVFAIDDRGEVDETDFEVPVLVIAAEVFELTDEFFHLPESPLKIGAFFTDGLGLRAVLQVFAGLVDIGDNPFDERECPIRFVGGKKQFRFHVPEEA